MDERTLHAIQKSYDRIADEYARHIFPELDNKPLDRELLTRFAAEVKGKGETCDMGCGPGHIARFLRDADGAGGSDNLDVFGLDLSPRMIEEARRLNPDISFRQGNMLALDLPDATLAASRLSTQSSIFPGNLCLRSFGRWRACCNQVDSCCSPTMSVTTRCTETNGGSVPYPWTSISFSRRPFSAIWKPPVSQSKKSSSATPTHQK
jgi:SAM-dependent methyltransferase